MPTFLCFDMMNRRAEDADLVEGENPGHACQEYAAALDGAGAEFSREPYIVAVRYEAGDPNKWDVYRIRPVVTVEYRIEQPDMGELDRARHNATLRQQPQRPVITPPPVSRIPGFNPQPFPEGPEHPDMPGDPSLYQ